MDREGRKRQTSLPASWSREAIHGEVEERRREEVVRGPSLHCMVRSPGSKESRRALRVGAREGGVRSASSGGIGTTEHLSQ